MEPNSSDTNLLIDALQTELLGGVRWGRSGRIVALLERIAERGDPAPLFFVARALRESDPQVRDAAARALRDLLARLPDRFLANPSGYVRYAHWYAIGEFWEGLRPDTIDEWLIGDASCQAAILGLISSHSNGYVREAAVRRLSQIDSGDEVPFLLGRLNDWVDVIAETARAAVLARLNSPRWPAFVARLPLVLRLLEVRRRDLASIAHGVVDRLLQPEHDDILRRAIHHSDDHTSRLLTRLGLATTGEGPARLIRHALESSDLMVRAFAAQRAGEVLPIEELTPWSVKLLRERFMPLRRAGWEMAAQLAERQSTAAATEVWRGALLDRSASIRELARFWLRRLGGCDPAEFYRQAFDAAEASGADLGREVVLGLAETGERADLTRLLPLLAHPRPGVRRAAARGVGRIDEPDVAPRLAELLLDASPGVVREAERQLQSRVEYLPGDRLIAAIDAAPSPRTARSVVRLLVAKGKWASLPWLLRLVNSSNVDAATLARQAVIAWFSPPACNSVFTRPTPQDRQAIEAALSELGDANFAHEVREWLVR